MASIATQPDGRRRITFEAGDGKRRTLRLGKCPLRAAETVRLHVERLLASKLHGSPLERDTAVWLGEIGDKLHARIAAVGLCQPRETKIIRLGVFIDGYLAQRTDVKPGTMIVFQQAQRWLVRFLGEDKLLTAITAGDADAYRAHLLTKGRARATVNKWCQYARHFFEVAKRRKLIEDNPFAHIKGAVRGNLNRRIFVPAADVQQLIDYIPDEQWKLLIALARFGGLRIPSEALTLKWADVDFEHQRFTVRASKTEHHLDGGVRQVPIFPELAAHFQAVFDHTPEGEEYVISRYRNPAANLRTQLVKYIVRAGLKPWPKPWQNLRASRATELADQFPSHVCAAWLGHTEAVADEFYRQVTDDHFARAVALAPIEKADEKAARKTARQVRTWGYTPIQAKSENARIVEESALVCAGETAGMGAAGFEPAKA